jgi:hypothetical protein
MYGRFLYNKQGLIILFLLIFSIINFKVRGGLLTKVPNAMSLGKTFSLKMLNKTKREFLFTFVF